MQTTAGGIASGDRNPWISDRYPTNPSSNGGSRCSPTYCAAAAATSASLAFPKKMGKSKGNGDRSAGSGTSASRTSSEPTTIHSADPFVYPWGGRCRPLERFCHYFLQVIFIVGVVCGSFLAVATFWLYRRKREMEDDFVFFYIGFLTAAVCGVLLSIQCKGQREARRKKQLRRAAVARKLDVSRDVCHVSNCIAERNHVPTTTVAAVPSYCEIPLIQNPAYFTSRMEADYSQNGTPWWHRETKVTRKYDIV